jgi:hypothetical protein
MPTATRKQHWDGWPSCRVDTKREAGSVALAQVPYLTASRHLNSSDLCWLLITQMSMRSSTFDDTLVRQRQSTYQRPGR